MIFLLAGVGIAISAQQPAASSDRERETYKIYSRLLNPPDTSHGENPRYLIAQKIRVEKWGAGWQPDTCVKPPASHAVRFREVLSDFESKRNSEGSLQRKLTIERPYQLLTDDEVKEFQKQRLYPPPPGRDLPSERFRDVTDLFTFSDVYFSQDGNLAMVHMGTWCGGLCARYGWRVFEKSAGGDWSELHWATCFVVAGRIA